MLPVIWPVATLIGSRPLKRRPYTPAKALLIAASRHAASPRTSPPANPANASAPIDTATPTNPTITPMAFETVIFSFAVSQCAASTVNMWVVAFRIEARPLEMRVRIISAPRNR